MPFLNLLQWLFFLHSCFFNPLKFNDFVVFTIIIG
jgi:hypothetical protein